MSYPLKKLSKDCEIKMRNNPNSKINRFQK